jgi:dihydrofolate reductase
MITILVAYDENRVMGNKGGIPWRISEDFKHFKRTTVGKPCIMGRKTWDSLPENYKPLPDRPNIIVTRNAVSMENEWYLKLTASKNTAPTFFEDTIEEAIDFAMAACPNKEIFIIGGAQIYQHVLEKRLADRVVASEVKGVHEGDTFFPNLPLEGMELVKAHKILQEFDDFKIVEYVL